MTDSILRLKVESQEYDNKLKQATQGLTRYADECRKIGGTLEVVEKETLDYVRALGQMDTTSRTATGKLAEMKKTFVELSAQYKQMTDAEKASPFGKALAASLDQLKGRIQDSKSQLDDINKSVNGGGGLMGALDSLSDKFGMNIQSLAGWGTALAAGKAALDVAKDAFFASESTVDEWGRVMDSSKSLYEGFLTALNTGDISGYLSRIDSIVQAARTAYNELDRLGTMKTIQAPKMSAQQTENERMRMMIQTGRYIAPVDGRMASMKDGQLLTPEQIRRIEAQLQNGMKTVVSLVGNEVKQTGKAIDAVYNRQAQELGMSLKEFRKGTSSMAEFDKRMAGYDQYQKWREQHTTIDIKSGRETVARGNPYEQFAKWGTFRVDGDRYDQLVQLITQRDQQAAQAYGMQSQAYRTMNRAEGITVRQIMNGGTSSGGTGTTTNELLSQMKLPEFGAVTLRTTESMKELQAQLAAYKQQLASATNVIDSGEAQRGIEQTQKRIDAQPLAIRAGLDVDSVVEVQDNFDSLLADMRANIKPLEIGVNTAGSGKGVVKTAQATADAWKNAAQAITNAGSAMQNMEDPAAQVAGIVMQAIANIALGFAQASASKATGVAGVFGWIAAVTAGLATMTATIASIKNATKGGFAEGGIVPGNSYSGDNLRIGDYGINSGELVLTRAQTNSIAAQLTDGDGRNQGDVVRTIVSAEQLRLVLRNGAGRRGRVVSEWLNG